MNKNFLSFKEWLNEAISFSNTARAAKLIRSYLQKNTGLKFTGMPGVERFQNSIGKGFGIRFFYSGTKSIRFNWVDTGFNSNDLHSVDVWEGTKRDPTWHLAFDSEQSLAKILPFIAELIKEDSIEAGKLEYFPDKTLKEEALNENVTRYDAIVDFIVKNTVSNEEIGQKFGAAGYNIFKNIRNAFPNAFDKNGKEYKFIGTPSDVKAIINAKQMIGGKAGMVTVTVTRGGSNESYGITNPDTQKALAEVERIAYEDQLSDLKKLVKLVTKGASNALFIAGRGGIGKTFSVEKTLKEAGYTDGDGYFKIAGSASPVGIYTTLYKHRNDIILFDDADGALDNQDSRNLIKAATDTTKIRKLVWMKKSSKLMDPDDITDEDIEDGILPSHFEFKGKVIFISNLPINKLDPDGALRTRALMISIDPTDEEVLEFMKKICLKIPLEDGLELSERKRLEVVDIIGEGSSGSLNLRKLVRGLNIRAGLEGTGEGNWERLIKLYA